MIRIDDILAQKIEQDGFVIVKNLFAKNEIEKLREIVKNHFSHKGVPCAYGLTQPNAAVEVPEIEWLFYHPKILSVMRQLLGQETIMFTSHCDVHSRTMSGWHKDDGFQVMEGGYFGEPMYDNPNCRVYKVALYLQDHFYNLGGLTVRKGSHHFPSIDEGEEVYLKTRVGDIIVFDVRLTHTGQRDFVPISQLRKPLDFVQKGLEKIRKIDRNRSNLYFKKIYDKFSGDRLSIFFTYGVPNQHTIDFAINNMKRQIVQNQSQDIFLPSSTRQKFLDDNVLLAEDYFSDLVEHSK
jgi:hypothetical protein